MASSPSGWRFDLAWLWLKRTAARGAVFTFAILTILCFGVVAVQLGAGALHWLKVGTWQSAKTIAEAFPGTADYVASMGWVGLQRIGIWVIAQSMIWAYVVFGIVFFIVCGYLMEVDENLQAEWQDSYGRTPDTADHPDDDF